MSDSSCSNIDLTDNYQNDILGNSNKEEKCFEINDDNTLDSDINILTLSDEELSYQKLESIGDHEIIGTVKKKKGTARVIFTNTHLLLAIF
jgi:hypothetical protein